MTFHRPEIRRTVALALVLALGLCDLAHLVVHRWVYEHAPASSCASRSPSITSLCDRAHLDDTTTAHVAPAPRRAPASEPDPRGDGHRDGHRDDPRGEHENNPTGESDCDLCVVLAGSSAPDAQGPEISSPADLPRRIHARLSEVEPRFVVVRIRGRAPPTVAS